MCVDPEIHFKPQVFGHFLSLYKNCIFGIGLWGLSPYPLIRCLRGPIKQIKRHLIANGIMVIVIFTEKIVLFTNLLKMFDIYTQGAKNRRVQDLF